MTDEYREAEKAIAKELKVSSLPKNKEIFADEFCDLAVRRELKLRAYQRAVKEMEGLRDAAENRLISSWLKNILYIIRKHTGGTE